MTSVVVNARLRRLHLPIGVCNNGVRPLLTAGIALVIAVWLIPPATISARAGRCTVSSVSPIIFGGYNPFAVAPLDSVGSITYVCTGSAKVRIVIALSGMLSDQTRSMTGAQDTMSYNVYADAARSVLWGDGTFGVPAFDPGNALQNVPTTTFFYGRVGSGQDVFPGSYAASLVATLIF